MALPGGRKSFEICVAVLIQYRRVTDTQSASQPPSHVALASTHYAHLHRAVISAWRRRKHCALAVVRRSQKFRPAADPFPGVRDGQNFSAGNGRDLYLQTQIGEDRCTQFRVIVVTDPQTNQQTHKQTHKQTGAITIHCVAASLARSIINKLLLNNIVMQVKFFQYNWPMSVPGISALFSEICTPCIFRWPDTDLR